MKAVAMTVASLALVSCGGSGAGGDGGSNGTPTTPAANEFLITGPIVNLKGSGMVIVNTGSNGVVEGLTGPGLAAFEFPRLATGQSYNVTIKTQPTNPSQICTVTGGVGKVTGPTTTISITCVTSTFEVRGSIGGLTAVGLTLSLNGGTAQAITTGSTSFTFPPIESGALYAVTIGAQPAGQTCVINNGAGSVKDAAVTTVQVLCAAVGTTPTITIGGRTAGLGGDGLALTLNGGTPFPIASSGGNGVFAFPPTTLKAGDRYSALIVAQPFNASGSRFSCGLGNARGQIVGTNSVTNMVVHCAIAGPQYQNGGFVTTLNGKRQFLIIWPDNNFALVQRADQAACPNNGNGLEYGHFLWRSDNTWQVSWAMYDNTGSCGIWDPTTTPFSGFVGKIAETATTLTLTPTGGSGLVLDRLASPVGSIVGTWTRNDGHDGSAVIFEANGTYIYVDPQEGQNTGDRAGVERGCYTVSGSTLRIDLSATCRPDGDAGFDTNGTSGFSTRAGTAIPFTISGADILTIGGFAPMKRMVP